MTAPPSAEEAVVETGVIEMMNRDRDKMRRAGGALAEAAMFTIHNFDGLHRLSLAVAAWAECIGNEGDRDLRNHLIGETR